MKIGGEQVDNSKALFGPFIVVRGDKKFAIYAQPVWNLSEFNALCPRPKPPITGWAPNGQKNVADYKSPKYQEDLEEYQNRKWGYMVLKSLQPTNLELDGANLEDPATWSKVEEALRVSEDNPNGLSHFEFAEVMKLVDEANCMDAAKMEENRQSFLAEQARREEAENGPNSQSSGLSNS